jgi:phage shock protein A
MNQVRKLEQEERELRAKTAANLRAGNRDLAGQQALRLQTVQRELAENRKQVEQAETTYRELLRARDVSIRAAQAKLAAVKSSLDDLKVKKATAELNEMAAGLVTNLGGSGDTLDRLRAMIEEEREYASGRARVARDTLQSGGDFAIAANEQRALADQALTDFEQAEGLVIDTPELRDPQKTLPDGR